MKSLLVLAFLLIKSKATLSKMLILLLPNFFACESGIVWTFFLFFFFNMAIVLYGSL